MRVTDIRRQMHANRSAEPAEESQRSSACGAYGCPLPGSVNMGSGWLCHCHGWMDTSSWQSITRAINDHDWLVGLLGDIQRLYVQGDQDKPWLRMAREFWVDDPTMQPTEREAGHFSDYVWRMRKELEFRVGARRKAPTPWVPPPLHPTRKPSPQPAP